MSRLPTSKASAARVAARHKCVPEGMVLHDYVRGYKQISQIRRIPIAKSNLGVVVGLEAIKAQDMLIRGKPYMPTKDMEALFNGEVVIEEKVDGHPMIAIHEGYTFFCESLKVQHSVDYDNCPYSLDGWPDMLVVYDVLEGEHHPPYSPGGGKGKWLTRSEKETVCRMVGAPVVPLVFKGRVTPEGVPALADRLSSFGGSASEGVVIKNLKAGIFGKFINIEFQQKLTDEDTWGGVHPEQRGLKNRRKASAARVAARYKNKKEVPKAKGKGTTTVYEYSDRQIQHRDREKAKKIEKLRNNLHKLQAQVKTDLKSDDDKVQHTALAVGVMNATFERVGNETSAKDGHFGVTCWQADHVNFSGGTATITYVGKSGVDQKKTITDASLVAGLKRALKGKSGKDSVFSISARDVNAYLKPHGITAKDIRGYHANREVQTRLKAIRGKGGKLPPDKKERETKLKAEFKQAIEEAAKEVGHEPTTLRSQYLSNGIEDNYLRDGKVKDNLAKQGSTRTAAYEPLRHCPDCQGIIHDGPRYHEHCDDCGYDVKMGDLLERRAGQDWLPIPDTDPRVAVWQAHLAKQQDWLAEMFGTRTASAKVAAPSWGYHVSPSKNDRKIEDHGLEPRRGSQGVYVWGDLQYAEWFQDYDETKGRQTLWRVDLRGLPLKRDPETLDMGEWSSRFHEGEDGQGYIYRGTIPSGRIQKWAAVPQHRQASVANVVRGFAMSGPTSLALFDFDGTMFAKTPSDPPAWWEDDTPFSWDSDEVALSPPCVPEKPGRGWWNRYVVQAAREASNDRSVYMVLVTARVKTLKPRILTLLQQQGIKPNGNYFNPGMGAAAYKKKLMTQLLTKIPTITSVDIWEDENLREYESHLRGLAKTLDRQITVHTYPVAEREMPVECGPPSRMRHPGVRMARQMQVTPEVVAKLRKDWLGLSKNVPRANARDKIQQFRKGLRKWQEHLEEMGAQIRKDLQGRIRTETGNKGWAEYYLKNMTAFWNLSYELMGFPSLKDVDLSQTEDVGRKRLGDAGYSDEEIDQHFRRRPGYSVEELENHTVERWQNEAGEWVKRARRKAPAAWKWLDEFHDWTTRDGHYGGGGDAFVWNARETVNQTVEGFQVQLVGYTDTGSQRESMESVVHGLRAYRQKAGKVYPWLLKNQLPIQLQFEANYDPGAAWYSHDRVEVGFWGMNSKPDRFAHVMAHEMGHHIFQQSLNGRQRDFWNNALKGDFGPLDLREVLKKMKKGESLGDFGDRVEKEDPVLHLQVNALAHMPGYRDHHPLDMYGVQEFVDKGIKEIRVPKHPITAYAGKNNEEAFCETLGLLVGYGPMAVSSEVKTWFWHLLPNVRMGSAKHVVASRVAAAFLQGSVK